MKCRAHPRLARWLVHWLPPFSMYLHEEQAENEIKKCTFGGSKFMSISANMNHRHSFLSCDDLGSCKHHRSCLRRVCYRELRHVQNMISRKDGQMLGQMRKHLGHSRARKREEGDSKRMLIQKRGSDVRCSTACNSAVKDL